MLRLIFTLALITSSAFAKGAVEPWKGQPPLHEFTVGVGGGLALNGPDLGGVIVASVAKKLLHNGFLDDINDQVFLEIQGGPEFVSGVTAFGVSTHLRWDFNRNDDLTLFGIGGFWGLFGTNITHFSPRFGAGLLWHLEYFAIRTELSHNWVLLGAQMPF